MGLQLRRLEFFKLNKLDLIKKEIDLPLFISVYILMIIQKVYL